MLKGLTKALRVLISSLLMLIVMSGIYFYLDKAFEINGDNEINNFINFPDNTLDVIVLGSSHAQHSFDPAIFYANSGLYSYVAGSPCQPIEVSYQLLREVLKHQKPKVLVLEVFTTTPQRKVCNGDSCYVLPLCALSGQEKQNIINYLPEDKANEYRYPLINNHNNWKEKNDIEFLKPNNIFKEKEIINELGFLLDYGVEVYPANWWHATVHEKDVDVEIEEHILENLNNIYDLCQKNDIQLILYKTQIDEIDEINQSVRHKVWKWADEKNIIYYDFVDHGKDDGFYINIHSDSYHSNIAGAGIVTNKLYHIIDNLNINFNHQQNDKLDVIYHDQAIDHLALMTKYEFDPIKYFNVLGDGYYGIIYLKYNTHGDDLCDQIYENIRKMGIKDFDRNNNCFAIIEDGEIKVISDTKIDQEYNGHKIIIDQNGIIYDGQQQDYSDSYLSFVFEADSRKENDEAFYISKSIDVFGAIDYGFYHYDWDKN